MIFSTRSTYGLRAMIYLASHKQSGSVSLATIAQAENMSLKYLERLFSGLKKAGLVKALKGQAGGYTLSGPAKQITIYDIIKALEGQIKAFHCTENDKKIYCGQQCHCQVAAVLKKVEKAVDQTLKEVKLSQLAKLNF